MARKRVEIHRKARPRWGLKASLSSLPGWRGLRMINPSTPRFYSVHSFGFVEPGTMELCGGGDLPRFFRSRNSLLPSQRRAVTSHCSLSPFPPSCLHLGVVARVGWGGASFFFFSLCASQREGHLPRGWGDDSSSSLALPKAVGTGKVTEGKGGG